MDRISISPPSSQWIKVQRTGPLTRQRAVYLTAQEATQQTLKQVEELLQDLKPLSVRTLFLLDEPMLGANQEDVAELTEWIEQLSDDYPEVLFGVHCCGKQEVAVWMLEQDWPALSFDLGVFGKSYVPTQVWKAIERRSQRDALTLLGLPGKGLPELPKLPERVWLTPSCGLAGRSHPEVEAILADLKRRAVQQPRPATLP